MIHEILPVGLLGCNCSIFGDESTREAIVIDPGDEIDRILSILKHHGLKLTKIVITHAHIDHIGGAQKLKKATGAPILMNSNDQPLYDGMDIQANWLGIPTPEKGDIDSTLREGDRLQFGAHHFEVLETPGHTPGSVCLWMPDEKKLIAGDTLFRDSIGRTDLPGGSTQKILSSIKTKLLTLPEETLVVPGHGETTTIGREKEFNPFLGSL
ncbi:MAG: MBL fold metallo-hydrolase [Bryobacteraceae bacterium]|nr:MBL fold metallo-hydrolase [Bryobacteraceae bacterium]